MAEGVAEPVPDPCERCGRLHYRDGRVTCRGHRSNGMPCLKWRVRGATVCELHGGKAPQVRRKASERIEMLSIQDRMAKELTSAGMEMPYVDPIASLLWLVSMTARAVEWLAFRVSELNVPDPADTGPMADIIGVNELGNEVRRQPRSQLYGPDRQGALQTHPMWKEWNAAMERHAKFCKLAVDAGVSERMVRIAEAQGEQMAQIMVKVLAKLGLPHEIREAAKVAIAAEFIEIAGPSPVEMSQGA